MGPERSHLIRGDGGGAPWTVYKAGASYRWGRYRLNLNVDNVLDSRFAWEPSSRLSVSPYPGTAVRVTLDLKF